ncbi:hypothetical protein CRG98_030648 [Punica granatum]|uniref:Uncharacterized protein n=1 Tax=Punica granatum TaxID=22663 RepID=A0A2I0IZ52_PUNGR|nr:hypothetical protein CRG98_030648 [Punica granatum]
MRGKSRGSVRESGDSVERLEGCSNAKDARSGVHERRARGQACTSIRVEHWSTWACALGRLARDVRVDGRLARERAAAPNFGLPNEDEDECEPSIFHVEEAKALMSIDEGLSVVFKLLDIFKQECKLASCIEEEEASRIKGDSSWASRLSHDRKGETGKKLGSQLIAHSSLGVRTKC